MDKKLGGEKKTSQKDFEAACAAEKATWLCTQGAGQCTHAMCKPPTSFGSPIDAIKKLRELSRKVNVEVVGREIVVLPIDLKSAKDFVEEVMALGVARDAR